MRRISVVGCSGSGKSTLSRRLADSLDVPHIELDALHWGPGWSPATAEELSERVGRVTAADAWVVDGNYRSKIGTLVWERADTVVWLDPPRWRVVARGGAVGAAYGPSGRDARGAVERQPGELARPAVLARRGVDPVVGLDLVRPGPEALRGGDVRSAARRPEIPPAADAEGRRTVPGDGRASLSRSTALETMLAMGRCCRKSRRPCVSVSSPVDPRPAASGATRGFRCMEDRTRIGASLPAERTSHGHRGWR
ncbi:hypothetical protein FHX37_2837 [Haloactinospora alba]|uniref:Adenylate kinase family enzyme n=1 Tax=Haloactinospora alba TaxID=405555 RepID=A0A543NM07_9ACTN|nr:hypothetical protein FHX37_2837 [Haloactinospora alba]